MKKCFNNSKEKTNSEPKTFVHSKQLNELNFEGNNFS